jgi:hypothetical protein
MWKYWRDKKGLREALEGYYPELLKDPEIKAALAQISNGVRAINAIMAEKAEQEPEQE